MIVKKKFNIYSLGHGRYGIKTRFLWFWYLPFMIEDSDVVGLSYGYHPVEFESIEKAYNFAIRHLTGLIP